MTQHKYGGRYSTNYIEDIKPPVKHVAVTEDRSGLTNFRPFEEIAQAVQLGQRGPRVVHKKVWIDYNASSSPVDVQVLRTPTFAYTFVPPLTNRDFDWQGRADAYYDAAARALRAISTAVGNLSAEFVGWVSDHITAPVMVAASAVMGLLFGSSYTIDQGVQRRWKTGARAYALATALALIIIVGSFFVLNTLVEKATTQPAQTATSSSHFVQQASGSASASNRHAASGSKQGSASTAGQTGSTQTPTAASSGSPSAYSTGGTSTGSLPVGGYGGGGTVSPSTSTTTTTTSTLLTDPVGLVPYTSTTPTSPLSVSSGDKQVLGVTSPTLVTN